LVRHSAFLADVAAVPLVHQVAERRKFIFAVYRVYAIADRDKAYVVLGKKLLEIHIHAYVVTPQT
jgi:hypothetical protein